MRLYAADATKADERQTGGVDSVLEAEEPPGFGPPTHVHHASAEAFYVLDGEYIIYLEDREFVCPAGSSASFRRASATDSRLATSRAGNLNFYFSASMVGYFEDLTSALQREASATRSSPRSRPRTRCKSSVHHRNANA